MSNEIPKKTPASTVNLMPLYFAMMAIGMGQTVIFAIIPMLGRELGIDQLVVPLPWFGDFALKELAITSLTSIASLTFFIAAPYWGRRSDVIGRKPVIIIGLIGYTVGTFIFNGAAQAGLAGLIGGFGLYLALMVTRIMLVLLMSASMPASSAYVIDVTSIKNRTKGIGRMSAASHLGTMLGPALAYFAVISLMAPLYIQAVLTLIGGVVVWKLLPDSGLNINKKRRLPNLRYLDPRYRRYLGVGLVLFTMMGMVQQTLGFYFQDLLGLNSVESAQMFSLAMVASSSAMLFSQLVIVQRWNVAPLHLLKVGLPFVVAGYLTLANAESLAPLLAGMALFGLGMGLATPGYNVTATLTVSPDEQGSLAGLAVSAPGMGFVIGPLLGGFIYSIEPSYTYWCAGLILIPLSIYVLSMKPPVTARH